MIIFTIYYFNILASMEGAIHMSLYKPEQIASITVENGAKKANYPLLKSVILGFQAGAFIALGYLLFIRVTAPLSGDLAGLSNLIGAALFPIGLILTLIAGGELLTGNMMAVPIARFARENKYETIAWPIGQSSQ